MHIILVWCELKMNNNYAALEALSVTIVLLICDMIKGNESLVENVNFYFLAPLSHNCNMLHFDPNPITIGYLVTEL